MGTFEVQIGVGHPAGGDFNAISATVDTGATHSVMPGTLLERLRNPIRRNWKELLKWELLKCKYRPRPIQTGRYGIAEGPERC